MLKKLF